MNCIGLLAQGEGQASLIHAGLMHQLLLGARPLLTVLCSSTAGVRLLAADGAVAARLLEVPLSCCYSAIAPAFLMLPAYRPSPKPVLLSGGIVDAGPLHPLNR
jgi:hypothetical protein